MFCRLTRYGIPAWAWTCVWFSSTMTSTFCPAGAVEVLEVAVVEDVEFVGIEDVVGVGVAVDVVEVAVVSGGRSWLMS